MGRGKINNHKWGGTTTKQTNRTILNLKLVRWAVPGRNNSNPDRGPVDQISDSVSSDGTEKASDWYPTTGWYNDHIPGWGWQSQYWYEEDLDWQDNEAESTQNMTVQETHEPQSSSEREEIVPREPNVQHTHQDQLVNEQTVEPEAEYEPTPTLRNPNTQSSVSQAAGSFVDHALDFFHTHMNGISTLGDEETPDEGAIIPWSHKRAQYEKALACIVYVNSPEVRERVSNRLNQPRLVSWSDSDGKDRDDAESTVYRAESTVYRQQRPPKQVYSVRKGPRYNNWYPARGHYGVHRWAYGATKTRIGICVMGDVYGPYGRDHLNVLNWAWQTWPQSIRRISSAGHCLPIVDMIKQHVQCEIDLHHAACELLGLLRVPTPLVYRPWLEDTSDPPWHISSSTAGQGWVGSTEKPLAAGRIHDGPRSRRDLVQAVD